MAAAKRKKAKLVVITWAVPMTHRARNVTFPPEDKVMDVPVDEVFVPLGRAFAQVVWDAIAIARVYLAPTYLSVGGIPRTKSKFDKRDEHARLRTYVEVLDRAFRWRGDWGSVPSAIESELIRRAKNGEAL